MLSTGEIHKVHGFLLPRSQFQKKLIFFYLLTFETILAKHEGGEKALHCSENKRKGRPGLPDIERDGHHGVQHNDVAPEIQEAPVGGRGIFSIIEVPGIIANLCFPISMANGEASRNQDEYNKDLEDMYSKTGLPTPYLLKSLIMLSSTLHTYDLLIVCRNSMLRRKQDYKDALKVYKVMADFFTFIRLCFLPQIIFQKRS